MLSQVILYLGYIMLTDFDLGALIKKDFCIKEIQQLGKFQVIKLMTECQKLIRKHICIKKTQLLGKFLVF